MDIPKKSAIYWTAEFKKKNPLAFEYVFDLHYRPLCYYAGTLLTDQDEVEDTVSEVFVKLWERADSFHDLSSIKGFLYISTKNRCLDRLKQQRRQQVSLNDYAYTVEMVDNVDDYGLLEAEVLDQIYADIERLPMKARKVFKLLFFEGLKTHEVADQLRISVKTVRNQKARAVELLQSTLLKKGFRALSLLLLLFR